LTNSLLYYIIYR